MRIFAGFPFGQGHQVLCLVQTLNMSFEYVNIIIIIMYL